MAEHDHCQRLGVKVLFQPVKEIMIPFPQSCVPNAEKEGIFSNPGVDASSLVNSLGPECLSTKLVMKGGVGGRKTMPRNGGHFGNKQNSRCQIKSSYTFIK